MWMRKWLISGLMLVLLCGPAQAVLRDGAEFPSDAFNWTLADMVRVYGNPDDYTNGSYTWTNKSITLVWSFKYPASGSYPTEVGHGVRFPSYRAAVDGFAATCAHVYAYAMVKGTPIPRDDGNPALAFPAPGGRIVVVTLFRDTYTVAMNTISVQ